MRHLHLHYVNAIILPRQARDKHGESTQKKWDRFLRKYLPDDAFASELGMEKAAFDAMPKWKQTKALKKAELF